MKVNLMVLISLFCLDVFAAEVGEEVKCQGYLERPGQDRVYYNLEGKILKNMGRHYIIYGYTPVFKSKRLHKVLKISCVLPDQEFIKDVVETKEEVLEGKNIEVVTNPNITPDPEFVEIPEESFPEVVDVESVDSQEEVPAPINDMMKKEDNAEVKKTVEKTAVDQSNSDTVECSNFKQKNIIQILKCFIKDGYGSL